jgi:hypothetical protein
VPFDEGLAERVRDLVRAEPLLSEGKMFGGFCFMSRGRMSFGILGDEIMVRVGPDAYVEALQLPHAREMDFTGVRCGARSTSILKESQRTKHRSRGCSGGWPSFARSLPPKSA